MSCSASNAAEKAWRRSREQLIEKIGKDKLNDETAIRASAKSIFKEIDTDGNGKIDDEELKAAMGCMGVQLSKKEIRKCLLLL